MDEAMQCLRTCGSQAGRGRPSVDLSLGVSKKLISENGIGQFIEIAQQTLDSRIHQFFDRTVGCFANGCRPAPVFRPMRCCHALGEMSTGEIPC